MGKWRDWESRREQRKPANVEEQAEPLDRALSLFYLHRGDGLGRLDGLAHNACQPGGQQQEKGKYGALLHGPSPSPVRSSRARLTRSGR